MAEEGRGSTFVVKEELALKANNYQISSVTMGGGREWAKRLVSSAAREMGGPKVGGGGNAKDRPRFLVD